MKILHKIIFFSLLNFFITSIIVVSLKDSALQFKNSFKKESSLPLLSPTEVPDKEQPKPSESEQIRRVQSTQQVQETIQTENSAPDKSLCVVTIDGQKYNVAKFRITHGGGNIFQCSTDMSSQFHSQHDNSYLLKMEKYKI